MFDVETRLRNLTVALPVTRGTPNSKNPIQSKAYAASSIDLRPPIFDAQPFSVGRFSLAGCACQVGFSAILRAASRSSPDRHRAWFAPTSLS